LDWGFVCCCHCCFVIFFSRILLLHTYSILLWLMMRCPSAFFGLILWWCVMVVRTLRRLSTRGRLLWQRHKGILLLLLNILTNTRKRKCWFFSACNTRTSIFFFLHYAFLYRVILFQIYVGSRCLERTSGNLCFPSNVRHLFYHSCGYILFVLVVFSFKWLFPFRYKQAAFCYEELILCQPLIPPYHLAYAEASGLILIVLF